MLEISSGTQTEFSFQGNDEFDFLVSGKLLLIQDERWIRKHIAAPGTIANLLLKLIIN
jgi:hypothetical protein